MPYQSAIIDIINAELLSGVLCDPRFAGGSISGIANDGTEMDGTAVRIFPVVYDLYGNGTKVSPDDTYPLQIYHRLLGKTYTVKPASVGDRSNVVGEKTEVKMVVAGWSNVLQLSQEDLESLIASNFPDQIRAALYTPLHLHNLVVTLRGSTLDRAQVWREEYKGIPYQVKPEQILFSVKYQIEAVYKKHCFTLTDCQPIAGEPTSDPHFLISNHYKKNKNKWATIPLSVMTCCLLTTATPASRGSLAASAAQASYTKTIR